VRRVHIIVRSWVGLWRRLYYSNAAIIVPIMGVSSFVVLKSVKMSMRTFAPQSSRGQTILYRRFVEKIAAPTSWHLLRFTTVIYYFQWVLWNTKDWKSKTLLTFRFFFLVVIYNILCSVITIVVVIYANEYFLYKIRGTLRASIIYIIYQYIDIYNINAMI